MIAFLKAAAPYALVAGGLAAAYALGYQSGSNAVAYEWEQDKLARAHKLIEQESRHRAIERRWSQSVTELMDWHNRAKEGTENEYQGIVSDLESGNHRLRDDLRGCRTELSNAARSPGSNDGASGAGLSEARQRMALRIGADADQVVHQLTACQAYVRESLNAMKPQ